jgi:hypothetical protein
VRVVVVGRAVKRELGWGGKSMLVALWC